VEIDTNAHATQWRPATRYIVALALVLFGVIALRASSFILPAVALAVLFAYLIRPIILFLNRRFHIRWGLAVLLVYLVAIVVVVLGFFLLFPALVSAFTTLVEGLQDVIEDLVIWLESALLELKARDYAVPGVNSLVEGLVDPILAALDKAEQGVIIQPPSDFDLSSVVGVVESVAGLLWKLAILLITSVYVSLDADKFIGGFFSSLPKAYRPEVTTLLTKLLKAWDNYIRGEAVLMFTMGTIVFIGNTILGTPGALALGVISGFMEIIPGVGPAIALIPAVSIALLQGSTHLPVDNFTFAIIVLVFYLGVQVMENYLLIPPIMGKAEAMHPLAIILGITIGGKTFGLIGAVLTVPILATLREILRYATRKIRGQPPIRQRKKTKRNRPAFCGGNSGTG
jgi:predicted PurR-regulated permease PerM